VASAVQLHFKAVRLDVNAPALKEGYHARWGRVQSDLDTPRYWRVEVPLSADGQAIGRLEVVGLRSGEPISDGMIKVGKLVDELETAMIGLTLPGGLPSHSGDRAEVPVEKEPVQSA